MGATSPHGFRRDACRSGRHGRSRRTDRRARKRSEVRSLPRRLARAWCFPLGRGRSAERVSWLCRRDAANVRGSSPGAAFRDWLALGPYRLGQWLCDRERAGGARSCHQGLRHRRDRRIHECRQPAFPGRHAAAWPLPPVSSRFCCSPPRRRSLAWPGVGRGSLGIVYSFIAPRAARARMAPRRAPWGSTAEIQAGIHRRRLWGERCFVAAIGAILRRGCASAEEPTIGNVGFPWLELMA